MQTGSEALQLLQAQLQESGEPAVDIILKEHEPPTSNAPRFLKRLEGVLRTVPVIGAWPLVAAGPSGHGPCSLGIMQSPRSRWQPRKATIQPATAPARPRPQPGHTRYGVRYLLAIFVPWMLGNATPGSLPGSQRALVPLHAAVVSSYDNPDVVLKCLSLGASDYWIKPLRANEIRNLWTRVWWRKASAAREVRRRAERQLGATQTCMVQGRAGCGGGCRPSLP